MEGANGFELLCQIRSLRHSVSVVMMSAYESIDLVEQCILSGADAYLLKPLRLHEVRNIWQFVWRRRHEVRHSLGSANMLGGIRPAHPSALFADQCIVRA